MNDGSTDQSLEILQSYQDQIQLINFTKNRGKSYAMVAGVRAATADIIVFCDADLVSITQDHLRGLIEPMRLDIADQVLAIRQSDLLPFKQLTGERAYRRIDLLPLLDRLEHTKFGAETYLNKEFSQERTYWLMTKGLMQAGKMDENFVTGYIRAGAEIMTEVLRQQPSIRDNQLYQQFRKISDNYLQQLNDLIKKLENEMWGDKTERKQSH